VIPTFNRDRVHLCPSPDLYSVMYPSLQRRVKGFFSCCTCSMSVISNIYRIIKVSYESNIPWVAQG
jgi:hypothetical protein